MLSFIVYTIFIQIPFLFPIFLFLSFFIWGLKRQTSIHPLYGVLVQPLRMLVQSEPRSHTEHVNFEPSPIMVLFGRDKDFHVVRAVKKILNYLVIIFASSNVYNSSK